LGVRVRIPPLARRSEALFESRVPTGYPLLGYVVYMRTPSEHVAADGTHSWKVGYRLAGRQSSLTFYSATGKAEAIKFCKTIDSIGVERALALLGETNDAGPGDGVPTLDEWAERHIYMPTGVEDGTRDDYRKLYARTWSPIFGKMPVTLVNHDAVARAVNELSDGRADKSIANAHDLLASMMNAAVRDDLIDKSPCASTRLPGARRIRRSGIGF
jgi:integrase